MRALSVGCTIAIMLGGCAGISYVVENYAGIEKHEVIVPGDDEYRVFDKPQQGKMMVTSSLGSAAGQGAVKGLTLGAMDGAPPKPRFQKAAETYLASTGRASCRVTDGYLLVQPQWEFVYDCSSPPPAVAMRSRR